MSGKGFKFREQAVCLSQTKIFKMTYKNGKPNWLEKEFCLNEIRRRNITIEHAEHEFDTEQLESYESCSR